MSRLTKEEVLQAFKEEKGKRRFLLYSYYRDIFFNQGYPAALIAQKISEDLGHQISTQTIYQINARIIPKTRSQKNNPINQGEKKKDTTNESTPTQITIEPDKSNQEKSAAQKLLDDLSDLQKKKEEEAFKQTQAGSNRKSIYNNKT